MAMLEMGSEEKDLMAGAVMDGDGGGGCDVNEEWRVWFTECSRGCDISGWTNNFDSYCWLGQHLRMGPFGALLKYCPWRDLIYSLT
jgi:hypothetical protein